MLKGRLSTALYLPSPHADDRPDPNDISLLVIHNISLPPHQFGHDYVEQFFLGNLNPDLHPYFKTIQHLRVSSHLYIKRSGEVIQFVPFHRRAWHAGASCFCGREACNDFSIGIELEGADHIPYTSVQYDQLASVTYHIRSLYPNITMNRVVGHSHISPGRKTDPGEAFDWEKYYALTTV